MSFKIKQICMALCLMASLAVGHISACTCSHHAPAKKVEPETGGCRSHHKAAETVEALSDASVCDAGCVCFVEQPSPVVASKSPSREFKSHQTAGAVEQFATNFDFVAASNYHEPPLEPPTTSFHSTTLKSLLPSRAPPRL